MKPTRAPSGNPDCLVLASGDASTVDYRGGLLRELQSKVSNLSDAACAVFTSIPAQADWLGSSALVDAYVAQFHAIDRFRVSPENWSTMPVPAPDSAQTDSAQRGLMMLLLDGIPAPTLMLLNDGTVAGFWHRGDAYASVDFDADGEFPWSAANASDVISGTWRSGALPTQLRDLIGI